ncbi:probable inactive receptor kinase [Tanacetum coccineum]|uniref:Probable inactive receptor kinase n=1 Tax=Tanacetum coccineum TaxID=301880 RepID=A0ABQ5DEP0_9ASTR
MNKSRKLLSLLRKIGSWKNMFLCGKKSLEKPKLELPREIIEWEILPRLPAKSLPQFMCVCKQWRSLISSCEFTRKNLHYLKNQQSLTHRKVIEIDRLSKTFTTRDCDDLNNHNLTTTRSIPFVNEAQKVNLLASFDGLKLALIIETDGELWRDGWLIEGVEGHGFSTYHTSPLTFDEMEVLGRNLEANKRLIMEYLVNISKRRAFWSLNEDILKNTVLTTNTPYPSRKIRRIRACTHQRPQRKQAQYAVSREGQYAVLEIYHDSFEVDNPFDSIFVCMNLLVLVWNMLLDSFPYLDYLKLDHCYLLPISLPELFVSSHGGSVWMHPRSSRPKIDNKDQFELKGQFLKEIRENTFSGSDHEDANEHIEKVLKIVDLFHVPNITIDQLMLRVFPISLTGAASRWLRNEPTGSIKTWEDLKTKFLNKYCPPSRTVKKMEEINNFQQEPDETLYQA